jgi:CubicO group peptidase (beta-lactamase class C family)
MRPRCPSAAPRSEAPGDAATSCSFLTRRLPVIGLTRLPGQWPAPVSRTAPAPRSARLHGLACVLFAIGLTHVEATAQTPAGFDAAWRDVAARFHQRATDEGMVGGSLWFTQGGRVLGREYHGLADIAERRAVDENTIFHWASITKTFTAIAILQLRDRGRLTLDDPVVRYIPELRLVHDTFGPMDAITIRHVLTHSAGLRAGTWPWGGDQPWHPHEPTAWAQLVAMMPYTEILFRPGSRFSYSNPAIILLGRIIETLTGDDYEVYVDKNILKPLGMTRTYFDTTPYHLLRYRSNNYQVVNGKPVAAGLDFDTGITTSNSGLNAPIPDMTKYLAFLAGDAAKRDEYNGVLARTSLEEMWRGLLPITADSVVRRTGVREAIGLVFFVHEENGIRLIGHTGSQKNFFSFFWVDPQTGAAAIAVFNTDGSGNSDRRPNPRTLLEAVRVDLVSRIFPLFRKSR